MAGIFPSVQKILRDAVTLVAQQTLTNKTLTAPVLNGSVTGTSIATQAQQETGTATDVLVTSGRQQFHPSAAKGWVYGNWAATANASYNVTSLADDGAGIVTITWATDFSSANQCSVASLNNVPDATAASTFVSQVSAVAAGTTTVYSIRMSDFAAVDTDIGFSCVALGDQ